MAFGIFAPPHIESSVSATGMHLLDRTDCVHSRLHKPSVPWPGLTYLITSRCECTWHCKQNPFLSCKQVLHIHLLLRGSLLHQDGRKRLSYLWRVDMCGSHLYHNKDLDRHPQIHASEESSCGRRRNQPER